MKNLIYLLVLTFSSAALAVPNPAAVKCEELGGTLIMLTAQGGEMGACRFDRAIIENWTLWRDVVKENTLAGQAFLNPDITFKWPGSGNPASVYCAHVGGETEIVKFGEAEIGLCKFSDDSKIEEWTLFSGPKENRRLELILRLHF